MHTILGANGVIGRELSSQLIRQQVPVRQVSRNPRRVGPQDDLFSADLLDPLQVQHAVSGSDVAYLVAGLPYSTTAWRAQWPVVMRNVIDACARHGVRLVFFDNVYAYGLVDVMREDTPYNPVSRKGEVRAQIATTLMDAVRAGEVQAMIVRAADFYGPGAEFALTHSIVFERLRVGRKPQWVGNPQVIHTFTYTPDAGRFLAAAGRSDDGWGQIWHVPTSPEPMIGETFVRMACAAAAQPYGMQVAPRWLLRIMGLFMPVLRENDEMMYQYEYPYQFDSSHTAATWGIEPTRYAAGIPATLEATMRPR